MKKVDISELIAERDPFIQFNKWYDEHLKAGIAIPETVSLATASKSGKVSVRTVLLKSFDQNGFVFFTNYESKKGVHLSENPSAALLFYWPESGRQVRIEGNAVKVSDAESSLYFISRPKESKLSAWASEQSSVIPDRQFLENRFEYYKSLYSHKEVEKPPFWGGFRIIPDTFEFWHDREYRLHDRIAYTRTDNIWVISRLAP